MHPVTPWLSTGDVLGLVWPINEGTLCATILGVKLRRVNELRAKLTSTRHPIDSANARRSERIPGNSVTQNEQNPSGTVWQVGSAILEPTRT
jgi:hypothetical protein